jgi:hypothetical protein
MATLVLDDSESRVAATGGARLPGGKSKVAQAGVSCGGGRRGPLEVAGSLERRREPPQAESQEPPMVRVGVRRHSAAGVLREPRIVIESTVVKVNRSHLRMEMVRRGWRAYDLARAADVSPGTLTAIMRGRAVSPRTLRKIAVALGSHPIVPGLECLVEAPTDK